MTRADTERKNGQYMRLDQVRRSDKISSGTNDENCVSAVTSIRTEHFLVKVYLDH